jgi:hypothetical protein
VRVAGERRRRLLPLAVLALALFVAVAPAARAEENAFDELRFTTAVPGASSGVYTREEFSRDSNGHIKPLRHSRIVFSPGTLQGYGTDVCTATKDDFKSNGIAACPKSSQLGSGELTTVVTGPVEAPWLKLDATGFSEPNAVVLLFTTNGAYASMAVLHAHDNVQEGDSDVNCVLPTETPPNCPHGEFAPKALTMYFPPHSRTVDGHVMDSLITPPICTPAGWTITDTHTFSDGSQEPFVNHLGCQIMASAPSSPRGSLRLLVRPARLRAGKRACLRFKTTSTGGAPIPGAKVRFGRARGTSNLHGRLTLCVRPTRRGLAKATASATGLGTASAAIRVD